MCWDGEKPSFFDETRPKARKDYKCYECNALIAKGTKYYKAIGVWDGEFNQFRVCEACEELRNKIYKIELSNGCHGGEAFVPFGDLRDAAREYGLAPAKQSEGGG